MAREYWSNQQGFNDVPGAKYEEGFAQPHHGDRGTPEQPSSAPSCPSGPTITISREAGARGRAIGQRLGQRLGWQVYDRELMEYLASDSVASAELFGELDEIQTQWVNQQLALLKKNALEKSGNIPENDDSKHGTLALFKVILALGAKGRVILVGRGAHWILPESHTLRVRVVANLDDRVTYLAQTLRLSHTESMQRCRLRDQKRQDFAKQAFGSIIVDPNHFDMVLNSSRLGEDVSTQLIREAMQAKEGLGQMVLRP